MSFLIDDTSLNEILPYFENNKSYRYYVTTIEVMLYKRAPSLGAYRNLFTFKQRVRQCIDELNTRQRLHQPQFSNDGDEDVCGASSDEICCAAKKYIQSTRVGTSAPK